MSAEMPEALSLPPRIQIRDGALGPRPAIAGTRLDVWMVVTTVQDNEGSFADAAACLDVDVDVIETAMGYYRDHRAEVDAWINRTREISEQHRHAWEAERQTL